MSSEYWELLSKDGDPIEQEGCKHGLQFPRYAEFWARYVYPNRDSDDPSKFRRDFPVELEYLCNAHYSVWYHLTVAYRQLDHLDEGVVDIGDPLYHLATAVDLIERIFIFAIVLRDQLDLSRFELTEDDFKTRCRDYWNKKYKKAYKKFVDQLVPVNIILHKTSNLFNKLISKPEIAATFNKIAECIREYRNVLTHSLPPLRMLCNGAIYIPLPEYLPDYRAAQWSTDRERFQREHFAPAQEIIQNLADQFVEKTNNLWELLIEMADKVFKRLLPEYNPDLMAANLNVKPFGKRRSYTGGTIEYVPPDPHEGTKPSAYIVDPGGLGPD